MPAASMLGPMAAAIAVTLLRPGLHVPTTATTFAQAVLGCLIASALSPRLLAPLLSSWPTLLGVNLMSVLSIMALGLAISWRGWMPGTAAIWGMSPGAASAMVMMSEAHGADPRLVAVMQYLRLLVAALSVIAVGTLFGRPTAGSVLVVPGAAGVAWWAPPDPSSLMAMVVLLVAGVGVAFATRRHTLAIMVPVFAGMAWQAGPWAPPYVPPVVSALAFAAIGWHVGLGFTRSSLVACARLLPRIFGCIVAILAATAGLAALLSWLMHIDFLTAYLALNPGGMDAVLLTAAGLHVDLPLILAMQVARLVIVILLAPPLGRVATRLHRAVATKHA
jgi:membrane AbrB-like protein